VGHTGGVQPRYVRTGSSWLAIGDHVVAKSLASRDELCRARFAHEIAVYHSFRRQAPPVTVPALVMSGGDRLLVVERLSATPLDRTRYPRRPPDGARVDAILATVTALNDWHPGQDTFRLMLDYPSVVAQHRENGLLTAADARALLVALDADEEHLEFNHGDPRPDNILFYDGGAPALVDWASAGWFRPGYDLAVLTILFSDVSYARERIEHLVAARGVRLPYLVNLVLALAGELRLYRSQPRGQERDHRLSLLEPLWTRSRERLRRATGTGETRTPSTAGLAAS
jgi:hypothetical protein